MTGKPARYETYLAEVDRKLAAMPDDATRRHNLAREFEKMEAAYGRFQRAAAENKPTEPGVDAFDYAITIAGLSQRLGQYPEAA